MIRLRNSQICIAGIAVAAANCLTATSVFSATDPIRDAYVESFGQSGQVNLPQVLAQMLQQFDANGDKQVTLQEIERVETLLKANARANWAAQNLRFDLNGDIKVTRAEIEEGLSLQSGRYGDMTNEQVKKRMLENMRSEVEQLLKPDADGNGAIEGSEIYNPMRPQNDGGDRLRFSGYNLIRALFAADPDKDGSLSETEMLLLAAQHLDGVQADIVKARDEAMANAKLGIKNSCKPLEVDKHSKFIVLGVREGTSLSSVSVAGQDATTHAATVFIEPGQDQITLVLNSASPMIWEFKGDTKRLSKVIASSPTHRREDDKPPVGVVGLERARIVFLNSRDCFSSFYDPQAQEGLMAKAALTKLAKREPDAILGAYGISIVNLPSGNGIVGDKREDKIDWSLIAQAGSRRFSVGPKGDLEEIPQPAEEEQFENKGQMFWFNPTGIMNFKTEDVIGSTKVERYGVLPEHAGLLQLSGQGKITRVKDGWRINAPIRFPAGLAGAHTTHFILPQGISAPQGDSGHSCVFAEAEGRSIGGGGLCE